MSFHQHSHFSELTVSFYKLPQRRDFLGKSGGPCTQAGWLWSPGDPNYQSLEPSTELTLNCKVQCLCGLGVHRTPKKNFRLENTGLIPYFFCLMGLPCIPVDSSSISTKEWELHSACLQTSRHPQMPSFPPL